MEAATLVQSCVLQRSEIKKKAGIKANGNKRERERERERERGGAHSEKVGEKN